MMTRLLLALLLLTGGDLREELDRLVGASGLKEARVGIQVWSTKSGAAVYAKDDGRLFTLASNTKVLTCAAALDRLGPEFQFETVLWTDANGGLVVTGNGDPNLSGRLLNDDPAAVFKKWAEALKKKGVKKVSGVALVNEGFDDESICPGWKRYDPWFWWSAPFGTFSLNDNCIDVKVEPGAEGEPAKITIVPETKYVLLYNRTRTIRKIEKPFAFTRKTGTNEITFTGDVALGSKGVTTWVAIHDPAGFYGRVLQETLRAAGVEVEGEARVVAKRPEGLTEIDRHATGLAKTLQICLTVSQNFYAENILRTLGWKLKGRGTRENGLAVVREFLKEAGVADFVQSDGSGLSRENQMTPADIVKVYGHMRAHKHAKVFFESLAVNGAETGTLRKRMVGKDVSGKIHAKTGHINGVATLSGYLEAAGGDVYIFAVQVNDWKGGDPDRFQDRFCEFLIRYKGD